MLPRRFALVRHVDYSGAAGTGVIAYGVAFDDGQVVLRWSSAHRATSVLDSVEDLIAAHGHGETTSIEWVDAPPGEADAPAKQGGRRARRPSQHEDTPPVTEVPQMPPETVPAEPADVRPAATTPQPRAPADATDAHTAAHAQQTPVPPESAEAHPVQVPQTPSPPEPANARRAHAPQAPAPAEAGHTTAPVPTAPAASAQPVAPAQPPAPPTEPSGHPNRAPSTSAPWAPAGHEPAAGVPAPLTASSHAASSPKSNGRHSADPAEQADVAASGPAAPAPAGPAPAQPDATPRAERSGDRGSHDRGADVIDHPAAGRAADGDRRRHEAIATQPMSADFSEESGQQRPRRAAAPMHESPRSIFEEAEEPARPDLRLASSNGRNHGPGGPTDSEDTSPEGDNFDGYFSPAHQHLDTVTGLLDLPAGLDKRGRGLSAAEQDALASRRNGRHRGE